MAGQSPDEDLRAQVVTLGARPQCESQLAQGCIEASLQHIDAFIDMNECRIGVMIRLPWLVVKLPQSIRHVETRVTE